MAESEYKSPTEIELREQALADYAATLKVDVETIPAKSFEQAQANADAGAHKRVLEYNQYVLDNGLPDSAIDEFRLRWAGIFNVPYLEATAAVGAASSIGGTPAASLPQGAEFQRSDGVLFTTTASAVVDESGNITVNLRAQEAGPEANTAEGLALSLVGNYAGIPASFTTIGSDGIAGGYAAETPEEHTARILFRIQNPPGPGNKSDYKRWAREASPGVGDAYVYPLYNGAFSVAVFITTKDATNPVPNDTLVQTVQDHINTIASGLALVTVSAVTAKSIPLSLSVTPNTSVVRSAVEQEFKAWLYRAGKSDVSLNTTLYLHDLSAAVTAARGLVTFTLSAPSADINIVPAEYPVPGTITWT